VVSVAKRAATLAHGQSPRAKKKAIEISHYMLAENEAAYELLATGE
jgi:hypothetical protein